MDVFQLMGSIAIDNSSALTALDDTSDRGSSTKTKLENSFKKIGTAVASYFAVTKIVEFGKELVNLAADAETAAAKVNTLLNGGTDTQAYYKEMMDASSKTGVAMTDYAEATYNAISAGVDQAEAVGFVTDAIKLAKGGFTETNTAVDILTTTMNAYNDATMTAGHVSDVLIMTQNLGKTTVGELASSMGMVIPIASAYGVSVENLGAAYATMTAGGIATAQSTTYMKSMFTELAKDGSTVSDTLKQRTGKSFSELMAAGLSLGDVLSILNDSVGGNATAFAGLWSSTEAGTGALSIVNAGAEKFNSTLGQMEESSGAVESAYDTMSGTFGEQLQRLETMMQNFGIQAGNALLPLLSNVLDKLSPLLETTVPKLVDLFTKIIEAITPLIDLLMPIIQVLLDVAVVVVDIIGKVIDKTVEVIEWIKKILGIGNVEENRKKAVDDLNASQEAALSQRMAGRYADRDFDQQSAIYDYIYAAMAGDDVSDAVAEMLEAGIEQADVDTLRSEISEALAEGDISLDTIDAWFDTVTEESLNTQLEDMDINTDVEVSLEAGTASKLNADLAALGLTVPVGLGGSGGSSEPQANGLDFVSRDGMLARLHYGEAVLNRTDAKNWRDGSGSAGMMALADKMDAMLEVLRGGMGGQQIVLDTGVLVGATVSMMDGQLGTRAARKGRGN